MTFLELIKRIFCCIKADLPSEQEPLIGENSPFYDINNGGSVLFDGSEAYVQPPRRDSYTLSTEELSIPVTVAQEHSLSDFSPIAHSPERRRVIGSAHSSPGSVSGFSFADRTPEKNSSQTSRSARSSPGSISGFSFADQTPERDIHSQISGSVRHSPLSPNARYVSQQHEVPVLSFSDVEESSTSSVNTTSSM